MLRCTIVLTAAEARQLIASVSDDQETGHAPNRRRTHHEQRALDNGLAKLKDCLASATEDPKPRRRRGAQHSSSGGAL